MKRLAVSAHGALGGLIAGAVVALWFLVYDMITGLAFMTPMVLGNAVFGGDFNYPNTELMLAYSVLHFAAFAALGAATAWLLRALQVPPGLLVGMVFGLLVLSTFHYTGMLLGGVTAKIVLPPLHVLGSNLLAGVAFMTYLHYASRSEALMGPAALLQYPLVRRGLGVGAIGAAAVAAWFLLLDIVTGRPFFTPAALGSAVFFGVTDPWDVRVSFGMIAAYTALHLAAFGAVGFVFALVAQGIARAPRWWLMALMTFIVIDGIFIGTVGVMASWVLTMLGLWAVIVGNLLAVAAMAWGVWLVTPELRRHLLREPVETAV